MGEPSRQLYLRKGVPHIVVKILTNRPVIRDTILDMAASSQILIIEDDPTLRDLYHEVLTESDLAVDVAVDGQDGLLKIQSGNYRLALLDMMMPKLDGIQVLTYLKDHPPTHLPTIILLTNLAHDPVINQALELGAKDYIIKSDITPDVLVSKVKALVA